MTSWHYWSPGRWASRWPKPAPRCTSAPTGWSSTPSTRTRFLADEVYETSADRSWVSYEPVGVVLAVMPWNFPLWQVFRFAAPALMAGNAALLKHSPNTTGAALACQEILSAAGLPDGLFTALLVAEPDVPATTERLIADPRVGAVTITGSERAGSAVGAIAGPGDQEIGAGAGRVGPVRGARRRRPAAGRRTWPCAAGSSMPGRAASPRSGSSSRRRVAEEFTAAGGRGDAERLTVGDPEAPGTEVGPMARRDLRDQRGRPGGRRGRPPAPPCSAGGSPAMIWAASSTRPPCWVTSRPPCRVYAEEVFGPVATIITVADADEAVAVANDTPFGLGASVWSADVDAAVAVGRRITSGACFINALVASDARMPFGGTKRSGYGRELAGPGIREFVNVRTWWALNEPQAHAPTSE